VISILYVGGRAPLRSLEFRVLLGVVVFMRWVMMIYTLRTNRIVGTAIMSILSSMMTCLPFVIVLFSFICGVWNLYLAFGTLNPPDSLSVVWRMIVLGDIDLWEMDGLSSVLQSARYDDVYYLIRVFMVMGTFFFGLSLMNVFIAILAEAYLMAEEKKWKRFYRERALIANRHALQLVGARALRTGFLGCIMRCFPGRARRPVSLPPGRAGRRRLFQSDFFRKTPSEKRRWMEDKTSFQKHAVFVKQSMDRMASARSITGDEQCFLWVVRPECEA